jgi:hypothetical protein
MRPSEVCDVCGTARGTLTLDDWSQFGYCLKCGADKGDEVML